MVPLSGKGYSDAEKAGRALRRIAFDRVYCSDTRRAVQTMEMALPGCEAEFSSDLREIDVGECSGLTFDECTARYGEGYRQILANRDYTSVGGKSHRMHFMRVSRFMKQLEQVKGCENIAVFCHEGTIKCMLTYVLGVMIPPSALRVDNGAISVFRLKEKGWMLHQWNVIEQPGA